MRRRTTFALVVALIVGPGMLHATPLHVAAAAGDAAQAAALIMDDPSSVNVYDLHGSTPLSIATQEGHLAMVRLLLEKGAAVEARANYRGAPTSTVAFYSNPATVKLLSMKAPVEAVGATPLQIAAREGHLAVAKALLDNHAAIDSVADDGQSPLAIAALQGHVAVMKMLLDNGAAIEGKNQEGATPLAMAAQHGQLEAVRLLVKKGAVVDARDKDGVTPLGRAAQSGDGIPATHVDVVMFLLARGANPHTPGFGAGGSGKTALELAEERGNAEIAVLLREAETKSNRLATPPSTTQ